MSSELDRSTSRDLRELDERLGRRQQAMEKFGYPPKETHAIKNARLAVRGAAVSVYPGNNYEMFHWNVRKGYEDLLRVHSVSGLDYDRNELLRIEAHWDSERARESGEEDDPRRDSGTVHPVRGFDREVEGRSERVRPHVARNPRRRR